jgi:hypothetical protein
VELAEDDVCEVDVRPAPRATMQRLTACLRRLSSARTSWTAAHVCAGAILRTLEASAVLVHELERSGSEVRTVGVAGRRSHDLLGVTMPLDDILSSVASLRRPKCVRFDSHRSPGVPERFSLFDSITTVAAVPIVMPGRLWGIVEVVDADEQSRPLHVAATTHAAGRLARVLAEHAAVTLRAAS